MEFLCGIKCSLKNQDEKSEDKDFVSRLPIEVAWLIFRTLEMRDLHAAYKASRRWRFIIRQDKRLKRELRNYQKTKRKEETVEIYATNINELCIFP